MKRFILILLSILVLLTIWITVDLNYPYKTDIKKFDYKEVANLDTLNSLEPQINTDKRR